MTIKTLWGQRRGVTLAVSALALAVTHCGSTPSDIFGPTGGAHAAGATLVAGANSAAGMNSAGTNAVGGAASAGTGGRAMAGAAGTVEGGAGGDDAGTAGAEASGTIEFVFNRQLVPISDSSFAADLDGDGKADNAYGKVIAALSSYGFTAQVSADAETAAGRGLLLLALEASDSNLMTGSAMLELWRAQPQTNPDFTGTGSFIIDGTVSGASSSGVIEGSVLTSTKVPPGAKLPQLRFRLPFGGAVDLPVSLYSLAFRVTATGLSQGQLNGAALASDVDAIVPPALAAEFDKSCAGAAPPSQCQTALQLLDTNHDQSISAAELRASSLIKGVLAPDVKLFDAQGRYAPDGAAAVKDALSIGFGFTAVRARLTH